MKKVLFLLLYGSTFFLCSQDTLSLTFIGDIMQHGPQIRSAFNEELNRYEYDSCFKYIRQELSQADLTIANLEFTFGGEPYTGYPMFSAPDQMAEALQNAGIDVLVTANNHTCDRRKAGVIRTLDVLDSIGIVHTGSWRNQVEKSATYPLLIEQNNIRVPLLNYTYGTNGLPVDEPTRVNLINEDSIKSDLRKASAMNVDKIIAFMHWGSEYTHQPNSFQQHYAALLFEHGADIVIGAHPHVLQPMYYSPSDSTKDGTVLVYSLGNFVSNQRTAPRDGGAIFNMTLTKHDSTVTISDAGYMLTWVWLPIPDGRRRYYILPASKYEENRQMIDTWSHTKMTTFITNMRRLLSEKNVNVPEYQFDGSDWILSE